MDLTFNLERARAGEPIDFRSDDEWRPVHFVGIDADGDICIHFRHAGYSSVYQGTEHQVLRMRPTPQTRRVYVNVYEDVADTGLHETEELARLNASADAIAVAVPVDITFTPGEGK